MHPSQVFHDVAVAVDDLVPFRSRQREPLRGRTHQRFELAAVSLVYGSRELLERGVDLAGRMTDVRFRLAGRRRRADWLIH
jgi:hypothetical protein